jgi:hypothetical protein
MGLDLALWWKQRLEQKRIELEQTVELMVGSTVDKLSSIIARLDISQEMALLERNLAEKEAKSLLRDLRNLLATIHRDGGHYTDAHGLAHSVEEAHEVVGRDRAALDAERHRCLYWVDQAFGALSLDEARRRIELGVGVESELRIQAVSHETPKSRATQPYRRMRGQPVRTPRLGLTCEVGCTKESIRASGDVICADCQQPYWKHPYCRGCVTTMTGEPEYFIHVSCDGTHLKL